MGIGRIIETRSAVKPKIATQMLWCVCLLTYIVLPVQLTTSRTSNHTRLTRTLLKLLTMHILVCILWVFVSIDVSSSICYASRASQTLGNIWAIFYKACTTTTPCSCAVHPALNMQLQYFATSYSTTNLSPLQKRWRAYCCKTLVATVSKSQKILRGKTGTCPYRETMPILCM